MELDALLTKNSNNYRFHGAGAHLSALIAEAVDGEIKLYGRSTDDAVDGQDDGEWVAGSGYLYCVEVSGLELVYNNHFMGPDNLCLVLEKIVDEPQEWSPRTADRRESLIRVEEWRVIGAVRPVEFDEDGDAVEEEAFSLEDILDENF